jgi:putative spermidine/putrescine transport system permease protein
MLRLIPTPGSASTKILAAYILLLPAILFLLLFLLVPALHIFAYSIMTQSTNGNISLPFNLASFESLLLNSSFRNVLITTLMISLYTSGFSVLLGFPLALVIVHGAPAISRLVMIVAVAPLMVSVVVRAYGWQLLLGNSPADVVNWVLHLLGGPPALMHVMYTPIAVTITSLHVFLPMMVLSLASSLARIKPSLGEAARTLGASGWGAFLTVTLPLSLPGLVAGFTIVFSLTASSYVVPAILGGPKGLMLGNLLQQQALTVYDWPVSGAIAVIMVVIAFTMNYGFTWLVESRPRALARTKEAR